MEEAVLRTSRRQSRSLFGIFAVLTSISLLWPAAIAAAPASAPGATSSAANAPNPERAPKVTGLGTRSIETGRGHAPSTPLQTIGANLTSPNALESPDSGVGTSGTPTPAPVLATSSGAPASTSISLAPTEGLERATSGNVEPPDPWVAVGPDDVVQSVNSTLRFTNREGTERVPNVSTFEFFDLANLEVEVEGTPGLTPVTIDGTAYPRWAYDPTHDRWLGLMTGWHCNDGTVDDPIGFVFGAISLTNDPTGDYYQYYLQFNGFLPDYPMIGTSSDKIVISANEFLLPTTAAPTCANGIGSDYNQFAASLTVFDWTDMLTYPASPDNTYIPLDDHFALRPAISPSGLTPTIFVVGETITPGVGRTSVQGNVSYLRIIGTNASSVIASEPQNLSVLGVVTPFTDPPPPVEPGGFVGPFIVDRRPTDAIWQDNVLTFASTYPCDPAGGPSGENRDCARITQLNTGPAQPTLRQDVLIGNTGKDTWYPGIGQSQSGILHVVYTESSSADGMGAFDRYQLPSDAVNTMSVPREISDGQTFNYTGSLWGRYVGVAQDPRDTNAVWQGDQYTKSDGTWATRVTQLQTPGATFIPIDPVRVIDSRIGRGTTGQLSANVPRTVSIIDDAAIPANAVAITGNLTIVGPQSAGYATITPLPIVSPPTATVNFPINTNRGNNFTVPLSSTGGVSVVYKAPNGKLAHFVIDVTGYFLNDTTGDTYNIIEPVRVLDSRAGFNIGHLGRFAANDDEEFPAAGVLGIPLAATAVTGNLTVVDQNSAGYVVLSTAPAGPVTPETSTVNFTASKPQGNGVTVKLSPTGTLWVVFKAANGRSTDLIFDVTGYYMDDLNGARFVPIAPGRRMDTRFPAPQEGLTGAFPPNVSRTLVIEPYQGVPANAVAITGNLTVVTPTADGRVAMTTVVVANPPTSTLNYGANDTRGNGVTTPLSGAGSVVMILKPSGTAHLVLDITGYFR